MKFFEKICRSYFGTSGYNDRILWDNSALKEQNAQELMEMMSKFEDEWHDTYPHSMEILDRRNFAGSIVTRWTKVTLNFDMSAPQWYSGTINYFSELVKGADKDKIKTKPRAETRVDASSGGCNVVIQTDRYFNYFNSEVTEEESSVTVGLGGLIFSGLVMGGFAVYGGLATYAVLVLIRRRIRNDDEGLGY